MFACRHFITQIKSLAQAVVVFAASFLGLGYKLSAKKQLSSEGPKKAAFPEMWAMRRVRTRTHTKKKEMHAIFCYQMQVFKVPEVAVT